MAGNATPGSDDSERNPRAGSGGPDGSRTPQARDPFADADERIAAAARQSAADLPDLPEELRKPVDYPATNVTRWKREPTKNDSGDMMRAMSIGMQFAFGVGGMAAIGWALERYAFPKASPWVLLGCVGLGLSGAMYNFVREANKGNK